MWNNEIDIIPTRLNDDAPIWRGCSMSELVWLSIACVAINCSVFGMLGLVIIGKFLMGIALGILTAIGSVYLTTGILQKYKQGKPRGFVKQLILFKLESYGLYKAKLIRHSSFWIVGRKF